MTQVTITLPAGDIRHLARLADREAKVRRKRVEKSQYVPPEGKRDINKVLGASNARIAKVLWAALEEAGVELAQETNDEGGSNGS